MSADWFDLFGLRSNARDSFSFFTDAVRGEGIARHSAEVLATALAQRLVGREIEVVREPPIGATVERIDEIVPATALAAVPSMRGEVPMWHRVAGRVGGVRIGERRLRAAELELLDVALAGGSAQRLVVGAMNFDIEVEAEEAIGWAGIDRDHVVRVLDSRVEASHRWVRRWLWAEVAVTAAAQVVTVHPTRLRAFGRPVPMPPQVAADRTQRVPWLPAALVVERVVVAVDDDLLHLHGRVGRIEIPIDVARLLTELGGEGTRSVLRIATGGR